jgi:hypothetical protein
MDNKNDLFNIQNNYYFLQDEVFDMSTPIEIIENFADGIGDYCVPEIIVAGKRLDKPVDSELALKLMKKIKSGDRISWTLASIIIPILGKTEEELAIYCLSQIINYPCVSLSDLDRAYGFHIKTKETEVNYLSTIDSQQARIEIAKAIGCFECSDTAALLLSRDCSGCESILIRFCNEGEWFEKENAAVALSGSSSLDAINTLCSLLGSKEGRVAEAAAKSLSNYSSDFVIASLRKAMYCD